MALFELTTISQSSDLVLRLAIKPAVHQATRPMKSPFAQAVPSPAASNLLLNGPILFTCIHWAIDRIDAEQIDRA